MNEIKRVGLAAAGKGAAILKSRLGKIPEVMKKGEIDLVTVADLESEKAIVGAIRESFPEHAVLAEEGGLEKGPAKNRWIIDPLDGTTNFAHGLGLFCVSVAFASDGDVLFGVVSNPVTEEIFMAEKGKGATLNGSTISVSKTERVSDSLLVTGFPYNHKEIIRAVVSRFANCLAASQGIRRLGSAALDLCYVACGRFDGFWEQNLRPWDTAAGMLIAREAGGTVTDFSENPFDIYGNEILATNGRIHAEMNRLLKYEEVR